MIPEHYYQDDEKDMSRSRSKEGSHHQRASLRQRFEHFTWAWFSTTMATGSLAVVLNQTPNQFYGLFTIGKIVYILDVFLFVAFSVLITLRFILLPRALPKSFHHPTEAFFFGTFWVSISLILQGAHIYGIPSCGPWLIKALEVCFWLYGGLIMLVAVFEYHTLFITERLQISQMVPAWILPIYPLLVAGPLASVLISDQPSRAALPIWIGGVVFQGLGWMVATFMYAIWTVRLMCADLPMPSMRPGAYIAVGPTGYTAQALLALGGKAPSVLPDGFFGVTSVPTGDVLKIIGSVAGIFLWLLAFWYFCLTTVAVIQGCRQMSFNLTWWAFVFPNVGLTLALIEIGSVLNSPAINGVTSAMTLLLVIAWLVIGVLHVKAVWKGQILYPGMVRYFNIITG
jgi:C4-dicarboxylate transporter/malic acid transport protein